MAYKGRNSYERGYNPVPPPPRGRNAGSSPGYANEPLQLHTTQAPPTLTTVHATTPMYNGPSMPVATDKISPVSPSSRSPRYKDTTDAHNRFHRGSSTFDQIRMDCLRKGIMYEDTDFPANDRSLYYSRNPPVKFEWKRPTEIAGHHRMKPQFFVDGATRFDVQQGKLGDCWVLAAVACLTSPDHRELFRRVVPADQGFQDGWYAGLFRFNFWHFGKWIEVIVDDRLPTYRGELMYVHSSQKNEFWVALLEKAYAKLYGSYEALKSGNVADALTDFTGGITEGYVLRGPNANVPRNIVNILFKALDRQSLIGCGINPLKGGAGESQLPNGLVAGHAYSITDLREILLMSEKGQIPITLIRVRNPWGIRVEWQGPWGDRSSEWNSIPADEREKMGLVFRDDGEFWMDFRDFLENFDTVDICNLTPDSPIDMPRQWHTSESHGQWVKGFSAGGRPTFTDTFWTNPQYKVTLQDTDEDDDHVCSFIIQLMQKDSRKMKHKGQKLLYIGFVVYKYLKSYPLPLKKDFFDHNERVASIDYFINLREIIQRLVLDPGEYIVIPCTYEKNEEARFYLRFFFENKNTSEVVDEKPEKVDIPLSSPDTDKEEHFKRHFYSVAGEDMELNPFELHKAINEALKKDTASVGKKVCTPIPDVADLTPLQELTVVITYSTISSKVREHAYSIFLSQYAEPLHREIGIDACKSFVSLYDVDNSGKLGYTEFLYLWNMLRSWKNLFLQYDEDKSGTMNSFELRKALGAAGFNVNNSTMSALVFRYSNSSNRVTLDNYLICLARLTKLLNVYQKFRKNGHAEFTLNQFLEQSIL